MPEPEVAPATPEVPEGAPAPVVDAAALQAQIQQLQGQVAEKEQAAQYWHSQAKGSGAPAPVKTEEPDEDVLDLITRKGSKGVDELIAKRGYVKKEDVTSMVEGRIQTTIAELSLKNQYPDLKDSNSDFFKATSKEYGALVQKGIHPSVAMEIAAEKVELAELRAGKRKIETDKDRDARIKAQSPEGTKRTTQKTDEEGDDTLDPFQEHLIKELGITREAYIKRAKNGVQMGVRGAK